MRCDKLLEGSRTTCELGDGLLEVGQKVLKPRRLDLALWALRPQWAFGAVIAYMIGFYGGRPLVERFGKLVFVRERELAHAHEWIVRFGARAVFACKLLPGVRAVASLPAGVVQMPFGRFITFTFLASAIWCTGFAYAGVALGRNWETLDKFFGRFAILLMVLVVIGIGVWVWSHLRMRAARRATAAKS